MGINDSNPAGGFDGRAEHFRERIYGSRKGIIRMQLLWEQLQAQIPQIDNGGLTVGDLGGGIGQLSARLAVQGHQVTLVDSSEDMLNLARAHFDEEGVDPARLRLVLSNLQQLASQGLPQFDLVLCHAVLEWLDEPKEGLRQAVAAIKPGGWFSLAYYNRHALVYRNLLHGNFDRIRQQNYRGKDGGFTPLNPLVPEELETWLQDLGLEIQYRAGLRTFSDFMPRAIADKRGLEEILEMERRFAETEPFRQLGRYQHVICRRPV